MLYEFEDGLFLVGDKFQQVNAGFQLCKTDGHMTGTIFKRKDPDVATGNIHDLCFVERQSAAVADVQLTRSRVGVQLDMFCKCRLHDTVQVYVLAH